MLPLRLLSLCLLVFLCMGSAHSAPLRPLTEAEADPPLLYTCEGYLSARELPVVGILFMDGYASRRLGSTVFDPRVIEAVLDGDLRERCKNNPQALATKIWLEARIKLLPMAPAEENISPEMKAHDCATVTYTQMQAAGGDNAGGDKSFIALWLQGWLYAEPGAWPEKPVSSDDEERLFVVPMKGFVASWPLHPDESALERMRKVLTK